MPRRRRPGRYDQPHYIYTLADPRTHEIRYVGRTAQDPFAYFRKRLRDARQASRRPVDRWICRLRQKGLTPIFRIRKHTVDRDAERCVSETLARRGARLLNTLPTATRDRGKILVDVEEGPAQWFGDVVHLAIRVQAEDRGDLLRKGAVAALHRLADLLANGGPQYEEGFALSVIGSLFEWCDNGHVRTGALAALPLFFALAKGPASMK